MPARSRHPAAFTAGAPPNPRHFPAVPPRPHGGGGGDAHHHLGLEPMLPASDPSSRRGVETVRSGNRKEREMGGERD
jgi:hypothetical protein